MQSLSCRIIVDVILLLLPAYWSSASAENIRVSYASLGTGYVDHIVAMEKGYFREEGLNVEAVKAGGGVATPALLSGQLHFSTSAATALSGAIRGGPLKIVYTNRSWFPYKLVSNKPDIKTVRDLVEKKVVVAHVWRCPSPVHPAGAQETRHSPLCRSFYHGGNKPGALCRF